MILSLLFNKTDSIKTCVSDGMINEFAPVGGMRMAQETPVLWEKPPQWNSVHHKCNMT
jgi:hypothetical protein